MIEYLVPDMPSLNQITPYLKEVDGKRWYSNFGPLEQQFRAKVVNQFSDALTSKNVATCNSGTSAISLALRALELKKGSLVLIPSFTFPGTVSAVIDAGYKPVLCDVDKTSWKMDPELFDWYFQRMDIKAIVPVATFGSALDVKVWNDVSSKYKVPVIVDAAAALSQQSVGDLILCFSLHATKLIGAGEGGLVVSRDTDFIEKVISYSNFGFHQGEILSVGTNAKFSEYHAAVGLAQLDRVEHLIKVRKQVFDLYKSNLDQLQQRGLLALQCIDQQHVPSSLVVKFPYASARLLWDILIKQGIQTRQLYCPSLHEHSGLLKESLFFKEQLAVCSELSCSTLALPYHNFLSHQDVETVCEQLTQAIDLVSNQGSAVN